MAPFATVTHKWSTAASLYTSADHSFESTTSQQIPHYFDGETTHSKLYHSQSVWPVTTPPSKRAKCLGARSRNTCSPFVSTMTDYEDWSPLRLAITTLTIPCRTVCRPPTDCREQSYIKDSTIGRNRVRWWHRVEARPIRTFRSSNPRIARLITNHDPVQKN